MGDNVGDVAGMGADLYSSFVGSIVASAVLGFKQHGHADIALPFWVSMAGIVCAVIGMLTIQVCGCVLMILFALKKKLISLWFIFSSFKNRPTIRPP